MRLLLLILSIIIVTLPIHSQGVDCEIISQYSRIQLNGKKLMRTDSVLIQINNLNGDDYAAVYIPYSKGDKISIKEAWIEDVYGNIVRKLKNGDINDRNAVSNASLYTDHFIKHFELKHNKYPYRIRYTYTAVYDKFLRLYSFYPGGIPQGKVKVVVESPNDRPVVYRQEHIDEPLIEKDKEKTRYLWTFSYSGRKRETDAWYETSTDYPYLTVQPLDFEFKEKGNFRTWEDYGNWYYRLNRGRDVLPEAEKQKIDRLLAGIDNPKEKIRVLYEYLQSTTRYINVSIKYGGLQTYPADYVCSYRYGDCKALVNYMKAMLAYVGIESHTTTVYLDEIPKTVHEDFPGGHYFNHAILCVPMEKDTMYLECTAKNHPAGYIHSQIQNRRALPVKETGSQLVSIPAMQAEDVLCSRKTTVRMNEDGSLDVNLTEKKRGADYEFYSGIAAGIDKNTIDKYIRNFIFEGVNIELTSYEIKDTFDIKPSAAFNCRGKITNHYKIYGKNMVLNPIPVHLAAYETPDNRKYGVQINFPIYQQDTVVYVLNDKTHLKPVKDSLSIETAYGQYHFGYEAEGQQIWIRKSLLINAGKYPIDTYTEFYDFIQKIKNSENKKLYFEMP